MLLRTPLNIEEFYAHLDFCSLYVYSAGSKSIHIFSFDICL